VNWEIACLAAAVVVSVLGGAFAIVWYAGTFKGRADERAANQKEALSRAFKKIDELERDLHSSHETAKRGERIAETVRSVLQEERRMLPSDTQAGVPNPLRAPTSIPPPPPRGSLSPPPRKP